MAVTWKESSTGWWELQGLPFDMAAHLKRNASTGWLEITLLDADGEELSREVVGDTEAGRQGLLRHAEVALESLIMTAERGVREVRGAMGPDKPRAARQEISVRGEVWFVERWPERTALVDNEGNERWTICGHLSTEQVLRVLEVQEEARSIGIDMGKDHLRRAFRALTEVR